MRRNLALSAAALIGVATVVPVSVAAFSAPRFTPDLSAQAATPGGAVDRYGMVRYDTATRRWAILTSALFTNVGLTGASCSASTGKLTVSFAPLRTVGTFTVDEDDAYAARYEAGAVATGQSLTITFRKPSTGAAVSCNATELRIPNSGLQILVRGTPALPPTVSPSPSRPDPSPSVSYSPDLNPSPSVTTFTPSPPVSASPSVSVTASPSASVTTSDSPPAPPPAN